MCIDIEDNVLEHLEAIHLFVTVLHAYFNPVSELDMLYNFHKVLFEDNRYFPNILFLLTLIHQCLYHSSAI